MNDLISILALNNDYFTVEQFLDAQFEFRLQQIGAHRRAFRRNSESNWKNNCGKLTFTEHEWQPEYDVWLDACTDAIDGLDMFAIDVLHLRDGSDVILELNDTAFGLMYAHEEEDLEHIKALAIERVLEQE